MTTKKTRREFTDEFKCEAVVLLRGAGAWTQHRRQGPYDGLTGLGETFRGAPAAEAVLPDQVAPWLLGQDARRIEAVSRHLTTPYLDFSSAGAEMRAASAVDIAL